MSDLSHRAKVFLVGAGPGDPGLLTLRAVECLQQADFVLYDYLTSTRILDYAPAHAEKLCVSDLPGEHPARWPHIHDRIIHEAQQGRTVVHLKGGDPLIFGRGGEEAAGLRAAGIPYEVVPGVTAAFAAGAYAEIPLTHRTCASAIAIITGHEHPGKNQSRLDWSAIAKFPGTLAIYMGVGRLGLITKELIAQGKPEDTSVALVHRASTGEQQIVTGTLATIDEEIRRCGVTSPSLVIIGPVVDLKPDLSWFESRPLLGVRVLVTRPAKQAKPLMRMLELEGAVPFSLPVVEAEPPQDWSSLDHAIEKLAKNQFQWTVFTSANGVDFFFKRLHELKRDVRAFGACKIAAIGNATAEALVERGIVVDFVPQGSADSENLSAELTKLVEGKQVFLAQAAEARKVLRNNLSQVAEVTSAEVYRQRVVIDEQSEIFDRLRRGEIQFVSLTSVNIASEFLKRCDETILQRFVEGHSIMVVNSARLSVWLSERSIPSEISDKPSNESLITRLKAVFRYRS